MKVLIVDDEQLVRWFLERAIKKHGHDVIAASSSKEALQLLDKFDFDVIFTDLRMPEGNGTYLVSKVGESTKSNPKIVVCSAFITPEMADDFEQKGIFTLKKPFKLAELDNTLKICAT